MGLKQFHIVFIVASILLSVFFGCWAVQMYSQEQTAGYLMTAIVSFIAAAALVVYSVCFLRKTKGLKIIFLLISSLTLLASMPNVLWACSVCFAGVDQNVIWGVKSAIIILLGALLIVMAALVKFFMSIARRSKQS